MILDKISLHNFGVFLGKQSVKLTPQSPRRPIVLFGGMNGAGKTTLLEGLQLVLYGKLSPAVRQSAYGYDEYLRRSIHRSVLPSEGALIELEFRTNADGKEQKYNVSRSWSFSGKSAKEFLEVEIDGQVDEFLSETWSEHIERFIPARLSYLFFFDGERIEALADPDQSSAMLATAINALLGIDLIEQLAVDLKVLDRRKSEENKGGHELEMIKSLKRKSKELRTSLKQLKQEHASAQGKRDRASKQLKVIDNRISLEGGKLLERKVELEGKQATAKSRIQDNKNRLINIASESLPLLLVKSMLIEVANRACDEDGISNSLLLAKTLASRDARLLKALKSSRSTKLAIEIVESFIRQEKAQLFAHGNDEPYLEMDGQGREHLNNLLNNGLEKSRASAEELLSHHDKLQSQAIDLDRQLAAVPDEATLSDRFAKRDEALKELVEWEKRLVVAEQDCDRSITELTKLQRQLDDLLLVDQQEQDNNRFRKHSGQLQSTLKRFRKALLERHTRRLESLILEGYGSLLRKETLVSDVRIDSNNCNLELRNDSGVRIPAENLSAGERQLLAVSLLWGLGRACGRPLPAVIDTPLGRLDSEHRTALLERYFPFASHQVLLLSTDEEINEQYHEKLKDRIGRSYRLEYDDSSESTLIQEGYFW